MTVLILGANGMLGSAMAHAFSETGNFSVWGTIRSSAPTIDLKLEAGNLITGVEASDVDSLLMALAKAKPTLVINCIGLINKIAFAEDPLRAIPVNSILPHRLARMCASAGARLVHFSTDCVFSGNKGDYRESDIADAIDVYGRTKLLGEVDYPNAITLRTSFIGHELQTQASLVDWFLSRHNECKGFTRAIFSGLPAITLSRLVRDVVVPRTDLHGLHHVSADAISKHDLLTLIARVYAKHIRIIPDDALQIDRSLNSEPFRKRTGWTSKPWLELIQEMRASREER